MVQGKFSLKNCKVHKINMIRYGQMKNNKDLPCEWIHGNDELFNPLFFKFFLSSKIILRLEIQEKENISMRELKAKTDEYSFNITYEL